MDSRALADREIKICRYIRDYEENGNDRHIPIRDWAKILDMSSGPCSQLLISMAAKGLILRKQDQSGCIYSTPDIGWTHLRTQIEDSYHLHEKRGQVKNLKEASPAGIVTIDICCPKCGSLVGFFEAVEKSPATTSAEIMPSKVISRDLESWYGFLRTKHHFNDEHLIHVAGLIREEFDVKEPEDIPENYKDNLRAYCTSVLPELLAWRWPKQESPDSKVCTSRTQYPTLNRQSKLYEISKEIVVNSSKMVISTNWLAEQLREVGIPTGKDKAIWLLNLLDGDVLIKDPGSRPGKVVYVKTPDRRTT